LADAEAIVEGVEGTTKYDPEILEGVALPDSQRILYRDLPAVQSSSTLEIP
jgi:hypothetical protein